MTKSPVQLENYLRSKLTTETLIGLRAVGVTVADHYGPGFEGRLNNFFDVLRAICKHQRQLGDGR